MTYEEIKKEKREWHEHKTDTETEIDMLRKYGRIEMEIRTKWKQRLAETGKRHLEKTLERNRD